MDLLYEYLVLWVEAFVIYTILKLMRYGRDIDFHWLEIIIIGIGFLPYFIVLKIIEYIL